ncbi:MAG: hypothetical protein AB9903_01690 [Vulcanimicrobiota bacterium]
MRSRAKKAVIFFLLTSFLLSCCSAFSELLCRDSECASYAFSADTEEARSASSLVPFIELKGDWMIMGMQYGKEAGPLIRQNVDAVYRAWSRKPFGDEYLKLALKKYSYHMEALSPDLFSFIEGVALGAGKDLSSSKLEGKFKDLEMILLLNCAIELLGNDEWHASRLGIRNSGTSSGDVRRFQSGRGACWAALKEETFSRDMLCGFIRNLSMLPELQQIALRIVPDNEGARRSAAVVPAGWAGGDCMLSGDKLFVGAIPVQGACRLSSRRSEIDYGVPIIYVSAYMASYCGSPSEAAALLTGGNEGYRKITGRATLLHGQAASYLLADAERAVVVERTAHHFYVRGKEDRAPQRVISSYFVGMDSFNDDAMRTLIPMTKFGSAFGEENVHSSAAMVNLIARRLERDYSSMTAGEVRNDIVEILSLSTKEHNDHSGLSGAFLAVMPTLSMNYSVTPFNSSTWSLLRLFY